MSAMTTVGDASESMISILHQISGIVSSNLSLDEMLGEVIGLAVQATACDACLVYLIDRSSNEVVLRASQVPHQGDLGNLRMQMGEGVTGWVAQQKSVVALPSNAAGDTRFKRVPGLIEDTYEAMLSVPLVSGGVAIGVINAHHRKRHDHTQEQLSVLVFIGEQLGVTISKSLLAQENARLLEELETRKVVERAKGILQQRHGITEEDAYLRLRNQSRRLRRPMKDLAEAIILSEDLNRQSEPE
jgi:signal transduction protein with GAF and PtsI domain